MQQKKTLPFKNPNWKQRRREIKTHSVRQKNIKQICANQALSGNPYNYQSIEAPPSTKPQQKYCDITGYPSKYLDPNSELIFYDRAVSSYIKLLSRPTIENFLEIRKAVALEKTM